MRILFISLYDPAGISGPGVYLQRLSRSLSDLGCKVYILTYGTSNSTCQFDGVSVHYNKALIPSFLDVGQGFAFCVSIARKIDNFCKTNRIDIINGQSPSSFAYALLRSRKFPFVVTMHGTSFGEISSQLKRPLSLSELPFNSDAFLNQPLWAFLTFLEYRLADKLIAVSKATAKEAKLFYRLSDEKVVVIPNGVDIAKLPEDSSREKSEVILSIGRLVWRKGFHYLINAMPRILASFPDAKLYIVGEGPEKTRLDRQTKKLGIEESVHILQKIPRTTLDSLFLKSAVYVQPSLYEPLATTVLEAMSFGKAIVATMVGGLPEAIHDKVNGVLVEPGDSHRLSEAIMILLSDPPLCEKFGEESMLRIEREFSWNIIAKQTIDTYEDLLKNFAYRSDGFLHDHFAHVSQRR